ncbi:hypothetical protein CHELA17_64118 [Chelatococcus asaccharovorans]|nr:hypothetical protein CHELA17_64118 [Chelatococcus asaccharovorans]
MIADNQIWIERFTPFGRQWHVMQSTCDSVPHAWPFRICPLDRSLRLMLLTLRT